MSAQTDPRGEARTAEPSPQVQGFLPELAKRLEGANVETVFAHPVERDGTTVIPVAKARWGMGGGSGARPSVTGGATEVGTGGGAGATVTPIGYIEIRNGASRFRPIRDPARTLPLVVAASLTALSVLRTINQREVRRATGYRLLAKRLRMRSRVRRVRKWLGA
jgi:uncharacterized spore protein YtfJ